MPRRAGKRLPLTIHRPNLREEPERIETRQESQIMSDDRNRVEQDETASTRGVHAGEGGDSFDAQMRDETPDSIREGVTTRVTAGDADKDLAEQLSQLTDDELGRLAIIDAGTPLPQGSVFLDLNDLQAGSFKAIGGQEAEKGQRLIAKSETDYELWNRLAGRDDTPTIERPDTD
jgi:hypothetical protein